MGKLPLIDVSSLKRGEFGDYKIVADQIGEAAREFGFFRISGHGIDPSLIEATYQCAKQFFSQSEDVKRQYYIGRSPNHRGYVPFSEKGDYPDEKDRNYEAFDLGLDLPKNDPDFLNGNLLLGPNIWPDLKGFKETVGQYYQAVSAIGRQVCTALELHLGLTPGTMTNEMSKPISQLRLLHYVRSHTTSDKTSVNMGAHTDYECLTLLHTRNEGLQVMSQDDKWIDVPVDHAVFVVNVGDMLEAWSNGILRSTPHRVVNQSAERYSLPYFVAANYDTLIKPFPNLVDQNTPSMYEPFLAGEHLERMLMRDFPYLRSRQLGSGPDVYLEPTTNPFETRLNRRLN